MNIFYLHENPAICAAWHCDKHCVKMILETAQLLSTAHHVLDGPHVNIEGLYKVTHKNHPSAIWARTSVYNYRWLYSLLDELCYQYTKRYKKAHKVEKSALLQKLQEPPKNIPNVPFCEPPQCMPDEYKNVSPKRAYISYYLGEKMGFARWNYTTPPPWAESFLSKQK